MLVWKRPVIWRGKRCPAFSLPRWASVTCSLLKPQACPHPRARGADLKPRAFCFAWTLRFTLWPWWHRQDILKKYKQFPDATIHFGFKCNLHNPSVWGHSDDEQDEEATWVAKHSKESQTLKFNIAWLQEFPSLSLLAERRVFIFAIKNVRRRSGRFSGITYAFGWPADNDALVRNDHTAPCFPVFSITINCFHGQHLFFQTCRSMENSRGK